MKNKDKFKKELALIAVTYGSAVAVNKNTNRPAICKKMISCNNCLFRSMYGGCNADSKLKEWAESEYLDTNEVNETLKKMIGCYTNKSIECLGKECSCCRYFVSSEKTVDTLEYLLEKNGGSLDGSNTK